MMFDRTFGSVLVVALAAGCGPRLKPPAEPPPTPGSDAPLAQIALQHDAAKLDANRKYTQGAQFKASGLFYRDGAFQDATVNVSIQQQGDALYHSYDIDLSDLGGASARVEMWDDGILTVLVPATAGSAPQFGTSNANIKAVSVEAPGSEPRTCYLGKQVLDGALRFALCDLQSAEPHLVFLDAQAEAAGGQAPAAAEPAAEAPAAPAAQ